MESSNLTANETLPAVHMRTIELPDADRFAKEAGEIQHGVLARADIVAKSITDNTAYTVAVELGKGLKDRLKLMEAKLDEVVIPARRTWQTANDLKKTLTAPIRARIDALRRGCATFKTEQERARKIEDERRVAEQKRQEEEKARLEAERKEAERKAQGEYERKRKEWEDKQRKEADERQDREEKARLERAAAAEAEGDKERADAILEMPAPEEPARPPEPSPTKPLPQPEVPVIAAPLSQPITPEVPKVTGVIHKQRWRARITKPMKVLQGVIDGKIPIEAVEVRLPWFNEKARKLRERFNYPGAEAYSEAETDFR